MISVTRTVENIYYNAKMNKWVKEQEQAVKERVRQIEKNDPVQQIEEANEQDTPHDNNTYGKHYRNLLKSIPKKSVANEYLKNLPNYIPSR